MGGAGCDVLAGGFGSDKFVFQFISDSLANVVPGPITADFIGDFNANEVNEGDVIDLSAIDANPFVPGDQPFLWIGSAAFDAYATAQLRYSGGQLYGSVDADADPEFQLGVFAKNRAANLSVGGVASDVIL